MQRTLILAFLLATCAPRPVTTDETVASTPTSPSLAPAESTVDEHVQDSASVTNTSFPSDSSLYIGQVGRFRETGELYTPVYFHNYLDSDGLFEPLTKQVDSLIFEDNEYRRSRLPTTVAGQYFDLSGLKDIFLYEKGQLAGHAQFIRIEYLDGLIEGQFIAVFKPFDSPTLPDQLDYCITAGKTPYKTANISYENIEDEELTKLLVESFAPLSEHVWHVLHTRVTPYHSVYSAISVESRLLLIETTEGRSRILKDLKEGWIISEIIPLHLESNGKPMLLLTMGVNETDITWTSLAVYDGKEYLFAENNRVTQ